MSTLKLSSGYDIPVVGFGLWKVDKPQAAEAVQNAIDAGYRHIDSAWAYGNEAEVGTGINAKLKDGTVKREELFVTSKLWNTFHRRDLVRKAFLESLNNLGLAYLDLYLMHWPIALKEGGENVPRDENGRCLFSDVDYLGTYQEMEKLVDEGLVRSIGISNFNETQIQRLLDNCRIKPTMHQFEAHPYMNAENLVAFNKKSGMTATAYSPFGSPDRPWAKAGEPLLVNDPNISKIAAKYNKTAAQVLLRYPLQRGLCVLAKSVTPSRIKENLQVMDFSLSDDDIAHLSSLENGYRAVPVPHWKESKYYPFTKL